MTAEADEAIVAEFIWDPKEYAAIVAHLSREQLSSRGWRAVAAVGGAWLLWTFGRLVLYGLETGDFAGMVVSMLPWLLFGAFWFWIFRGGGGRLAARRAMKFDSRVDRLQRHVIGEEGIHVDTGNGSMSLPWSGMSRVTETDDHFLWYWTPQMAHYTPKLALTGAQIDAARDLILRHAPDLAQLRRSGT